MIINYIIIISLIKREQSPMLYHRGSSSNVFIGHMIFVETIPDPNTTPNFARISAWVRLYGGYLPPKDIGSRNYLS